jgi:ABC-2 type transport system ATP-binding protein
MKRLGKRELDVTLAEPLDTVPAGLGGVTLENDGRTLRYVFQAEDDQAGIPALLRKLEAAGVAFTDLETHKSSLEDIFVGLVHEREQAA